MVESSEGQCSLVHHFVYFIGNQVVAVFCFFVSVVAKARGQERILLNDLVHVVDIIVGVMRYVGGLTRRKGSFCNSAYRLCNRYDLLTLIM